MPRSERNRSAGNGLVLRHLRPSFAKKVESTHQDLVGRDARPPVRTAALVLIPRASELLRSLPGFGIEFLQTQKVFDGVFRITQQFSDVFVFLGRGRKAQ